MRTPISEVFATISYTSKPSAEPCVKTFYDFVRLADYSLLDTLNIAPDTTRDGDDLRLNGGFVYLTAVMDWYSRFVLSWEVSVSMDSEFCVSALERSLRLYGKPEIFNTDQGSQFTSNDFIGALKSHNIKISMDGKGRAFDNIFIEQLWRTVKYEEIYLKEYQSVAELKTALKNYNFKKREEKRTEKKRHNITDFAP